MCRKALAQDWGARGEHNSSSVDDEKHEDEGEKGGGGGERRSWRRERGEVR